MWRAEQWLPKDAEVSVPRKRAMLHGKGERWLLMKLRLRIK